MRIAFNTLFSTESTLASIKTYFEEVDIQYELSEAGNVHFELVPLHILPIGRDRSFSIYTLLSMSERRNFLLVRNDMINADDRIGIQDNAEVLASDAFVSRKILTIKKNIKIVHSSAEEVLSKVITGEAKNAIIEGCFVSREIEQNYRIVKLDEREFGHAPGQGFLALTGPSEDKVGKLLRKKTLRDHVVICNIERKMADLSEVRVNNHCEIDQLGNIQLWAFGDQGDVHISQSTRLNIEERAIEKMASLS